MSNQEQKSNEQIEKKILEKQLERECIEAEISKKKHKQILENESSQNILDKPDCDNEILREIYSSSINCKDDAQKRKQHLEIKSLYLLQAVAILISIFGLDSVQKNIANLQTFKILFYILVGLTLLFLLCCLNDSILEMFTGDKNDLMQVLISPSQILEKSIEGNVDINEHLKRSIKDNSKCINSIEKLNKVKSRLFKWGLTAFIFSISILILFGVSSSIR